MNDTYSSDEQVEQDPLGRDDELDSDFDYDPLGDAENCTVVFNDPVEDDEFSFDEDDEFEYIYEDFQSDVESDTDVDTEESDSEDPLENVATGSKGKPMFCIIIFSEGSLLSFWWSAIAKNSFYYSNWSWISWSVVKIL